MSHLTRLPLYPYLIAAYPLWFIYLRNFGQASVVSALWATLFVAVVVWILQLVARYWFKSFAIAAAVVTIIVLVLYAYGPLHGLAERLAASSGAAAKVALLFSDHRLLTLLLFITVAIATFFLVRRIPKDPARLTSACNFAAMVLVLTLVVSAPAYVSQRHESQQGFAADGAGSGRAVSVLGYNPDIYYIILDGYARADVLRDYYDFDNSAFLEDLKRRGFTVTDRSRANYYWTFLSLASSLNYEYLQSFAAEIISDPAVSRGRKGFDPIARTLLDNRAAHFLRARGYRFVHVKSSSPETIRNSFADEQVGCAGRLFDDEYFRAIAEASWLRVLGGISTTDLAECHQMRLQLIAGQAPNPGPKFVFAHLLPPHHPYLFDRDGNVLRHVTLSNQFDFQAKLWEDKRAYLEQLQYTNRTMTELIDRLVAGSERPPIIIVQSDHGPNLSNGLSPRQAVSIRLANFAAYLLPGAPAATLPADCAPVNQFRYLFNHYFDARLPILPNKSYYSEFRTPLKMSEVAAESATREQQ